MMRVALSFAVCTMIVARAALAQVAIPAPVPVENVRPVYAAELVRVIDGDTYVLRISLGFDVRFDATIRLQGLDMAELRTPQGKKDRAMALQFLQSGKITVRPSGARTFARYVADVYVNNVSVADYLRRVKSPP